jgi:hypothetical protein
VERTTIEITKTQKQTLDTFKNGDKETYREVLQRIMDSYSENGNTELDETRVREISRETVNDIVTPRALE